MKKPFTKIYPAESFCGTLLLMLIMLTATSCEEDLIEHPKSIAVETFYNTPTEIETAVNAVYEPLNDGNITNSYMSIVEPHAEYMLGRGGSAVINDYAGLSSSMVAKTERAWTTLYLSIRNANLVIANAPMGKELTEEQKKEAIGQARFLRAFSYFHLVRNWGGVPLRTEANLAEVNVPKATSDQVYDFIIADLIYAEANIPLETTPAGRADKWAAKTLLAHVYLQVGEYDLAAKFAGEVMNSGNYSLVPVSTAEDWQKIFGSEAGITSEEVFYIHCTRQPGYGNLWPQYTNHPGTDLYLKGGWFAVYSTTDNPSYQNQDDSDLRKALWYLWDIGMGDKTLLNKKFIDRESRNAGNPLTWYRYADVLLIYAEAEARANGVPTAAAMEAVNQVHRRAFGEDPNVAAPGVDYLLTDYSDLERFLDLVSEEFGYEFQLEAKRWMQLKRTGTAGEVIKNTLGVEVQEAAYLFPIPADEMTFNKALNPAEDQNPGY